MDVIAEARQSYGAQIRLLICRVCQTVEELPDYDGPPEHDFVLEISCEKHHDAAGVPHVGHLMKVPAKWWFQPAYKDAILRQIREGAGGFNDLDPTFYDTRSTFHEDAMACFRRHQRPQGQCPDYKADRMRLIPKTHVERKEAGLPPPTQSPVYTYLCQWCPVHVYNVTKERERRGDDG